VTDDNATYGLGALPDPPDERDYPLSALYASEGLTAWWVLPASYAAPGMPPVLGQHATPMCVAYSRTEGEGRPGARPHRIAVVAPTSWVSGRPRRPRRTGLALALPQKVEMARPTGVGRVLATCEIPIEGRDEWLAAARRLA
jgi:hypothetical protein